MSVCLTKTIHIRKGRMHDQDVELSREEIRSDPTYLTLYRECREKKSKSPKVRAFLDWMESPDAQV